MNKNSLLNKINSQSGQALLIVVLVMVVALTVGLSIAAKSITSFRNSSEQASSQKALSAAEAGIEQALKSNTSINSTFISQDTKYYTDVATVGGPGATEFLLNGSNPVLQSSGIDLWLTAYSSESAKLYQNPYTGGFSVYWGDSTGACNNAALEVVVITGTREAPRISRYAFDPCTTREPKNYFTQPEGGGEIAGKAFSYRATLPVLTGGLVARVVPLYMSTAIGIKATQDLPSQGTVITSVGTSGSTERRVNVFQGYPELPVEYYLYNLFLP